MSIHNAKEAALEIYENVSSSYNSDGPEKGAEAVTADRLAVVELVRERLLALADDLTNDEAYALKTAIEAIRAAGDS